VNQDFVSTDFFRQYAVTSLGAEPERLAAFYDQSFLAAGPGGGAAFSNDEGFLAWLRQVHEFNLKSGMTSLEVVATRDTPISDEYKLVTVRWGALFRKTGEERIQFEISYILHLNDEGPRIAAYISHEDQEAVMSSRGLL
jgi:hypothetical protein